MNYFFSAVIFIFYVSAAEAQIDINNSHQMTTIPSDGRYEIVQSEIAARWAFRLDRYTGDVAQLVTTSSDGMAWEQMLVKGFPAIQNPNKPRFIIFTSGIAVRHTFLMDSVTGKTWIVTSVEVPKESGESDTINVWEPFEQ
jgi:hypothetical protein